MPHGRAHRQQAQRFVIRLWTLRATYLGLLIVAIAAAAKLPALPAAAVCVVLLLALWHLSRYQDLNHGLVSLHALESRQRRRNGRQG